MFPFEILILKSVKYLYPTFLQNAVPLPVKDKETLRLQFPVSSGTQHRKKEDEISLKDPYGDWQIVEKGKPGPAPAQPKPVPPPVAVPPAADPILPALGTNITGPSQAAQALAAAGSTSTTEAASTATATPTTSAAPVASSSGGMLAIMPPPVTTTQATPVAVEDKVFEDVTAPVSPY